MNIVNYIRFPALCFAMVMSTGVLAEGPTQVDRLELDASSVTGNEELPKVMYIVPWKETSFSGLQGKPVNSVLDEVLEPVDREVFQRQLRYHQQLHADDQATD